MPFPLVYQIAVAAAAVVVGLLVAVFSWRKLPVSSDSLASRGSPDTRTELRKD